METEHSTSAAILSLQDFLLILRRRRAAVLLAFLLVVVLTVILTLLTRPVYQATAKLLIEAPTNNVNTVDSNNPLSSLFSPPQPQTVETQVEELQAQSLLDQVARQVGPAHLSVDAIKDTNVVSINSEANSPSLAADAPNALLDIYDTQQDQRRMADIESAKQFVEKQSQSAHQHLLASETDLEHFKLSTQISDLVKDRENQINAVAGLAATAAKDDTDLSAMRAQTAVDRRLLLQEPATIALKLRATNIVVAAIGEDVRKLEVQRRGMTQPGGFGYTNRSPQIRALDGQITELRLRLAQQPTVVTTLSSSPNAVRDQLRAKVDDLAAQEASLLSLTAGHKAALAAARSRLSRFAGWEVTLAQLTRAHEQAAADDKNFKDQFDALTLREKAFHATTYVIQRAQIPMAPVRPKKATNLVMGVLCGLFVGVCIALFLEYLDDRVSSIGIAEQLLKIPSLGQIPASAPGESRLLSQLIDMDPTLECYRVLRTNIDFVSLDIPLRTLLVTSPNPNEGKTTTAINLAFAMAMDHKRVILVDTDLRHPSVHKVLGLPVMPGLTDVLRGQVSLEEALLVHEQMPNLAILPAGSTPPNATELLNSLTFRSLVAELTTRVDTVIFDTLPVLAAADAQILAAQMDGTVMIMDAKATRKAGAQYALSLLKQARANVLGFAFTKADVIEGGGYYYNYPGGAHALPGGRRSKGAAKRLISGQETKS